MSIVSSKMGVLSTGEELICYRLQNKTGAYCDIVNLGGAVIRIMVPDKNGNLDDVIVGYDTTESIEAWGGFFGKLVGRVANRIGDAHFTLNGKEYVLEKNNGKNHLHGGQTGFHNKIWDCEIADDKLVMTLTSPDGEGGYPAEVKVKVVYSFDENNTLSIKYEATADQDTILNLTNHAFFNLGGVNGTPVHDHIMQINADYITAVADEGCIPTGELMNIKGTALDFTKPYKIGERIFDTDKCEQLLFGNGYDHNYVINGYDKTLRLAAMTKEEKSGRVMETWTDLPGVQFYSGNGLGNYPDTRGKNGVPYVTHEAFCLETQFFPDSINHENFPS